MKELRALLKYMKPYKWFLVLAAISMLVVTTMNMVPPQMIRSLIQTVETGQLDEAFLSSITKMAILAFCVYLVRAIAQFGTEYISHYAAWHILHAIRSDLYHHMQKLSLGYYQDKQTGDLMARVLDDTRNFEMLLAHAGPTVIVNGFMIIGVSIMLFLMNAKLALLTLIPIPLLIWMVLKFSSLSRPLFKKAQTKNGEMSALLQDNFSGMKEIKAFTKENHEGQRVEKSVGGHTKAILKALKLSNSFYPSIEFVSSIGTVIIIYFGGRLALANQLPIGDLVAFLLYIGAFYQPITALGRINEGLQHALASAERVMEVLDEEFDIKDAPDAISLDGVEGTVAFENVSFRYVEDIPVLKNISFCVKSGETLALVGPTGVGKTTIANLLPRFYEPQEGRIYIDHKNINTVSQASLREHISIVSQDVFLFNGTVKENILYGREDASDEELFEAAKMANAHDFIRELAEGYETRVGERGVKLSGGQKQRISIARAVLKDAPILILDEATSAVDTQTELLIQEALSKLKENRTTIVIAHRLSTIQDANQIIVLEDGEIREHGRHKDLIEAGGIYTSLCKAQDSLQTLGGIA
ncbi:MAG TPA: ABC transporter ATP-binding protein [Bacillota bacterium]|nr:ABC transporter ATP-binding protein [Bacillota bacterium]